MARKLMMACQICGSDFVSREALAEWDVAHQKWVLGAVSDQAYCHACDAETHIEPLDGAPRLVPADLAPELHAVN